MFARSKRLPREAFAEALKSARRASSPHFGAAVPRGFAGYAVIVSKKTAKLATTRNRIKRRVRAALGALQGQLPPSLILYPRASVLEMRYDDIKGELIKLISSL